MRERTVVIGGGIVGVSVALHLQKAGLAVLLLDKAEPGRGCSYGNLGGIAVTEVAPLALPGHILRGPLWLIDPLAPLTIRPRALPGLLPWLIRFATSARRRRVEAIARALAALMARALEDHRALMAEAGITEMLSATDAIAIFESEAQRAREHYGLALRKRNGWPCREVSGAELCELEPALAPAVEAGRIACGVVYTGWRHIADPFAMVRAYVALFEARGGEVRVGEAVGFRACRGVRRVAAVRLKDGQEIAADRVVIAAGVGARALAVALGDPVPLIAERGYHTMIAAPGLRLERMVMVPGHGFGMTPMAEGLRIGGSMELTNTHIPPNFARVRVLVDKARRLLPNLAQTEGPMWAGERPALPDSLPVISRATAFENAYYAFGHGHLGLTLAPTTGRLIAALATGQEPALDMQPYDVARFG